MGYPNFPLISFWVGVARGGGRGWGGGSSGRGGIWRVLVVIWVGGSVFLGGGSWHGLPELSPNIFLGGGGGGGGGGVMWWWLSFGGMQCSPRRSTSSGSSSMRR